MIHQSLVSQESPRNVLELISPVDLPKIGHPARDRDITQVATAMNNFCIGEQRRDQSHREIVVGHLIDHA